MFNTKQTTLFDTSNKKTTKASGNNPFLQSALKESIKTRSGNGAMKLKSTLDDFVDQFGKVGSYRQPRSFDQIMKDCDLLWSQDKTNALKFIGYLRTITRKVQLPNGAETEEPQKGAELKFEPIMRMIWLSQKEPEIFWKNIGLFIALGSWHDVFTMLQYDLVYNGWKNRVLDWNKFGELILTALSNPMTSDLIKKYLPQIKARSACKTVEAQANCMIAKWICSLLFGNKESAKSYKQYRLLKTSGKAHDWQKLISKQNFDAIDFAKIHGRALTMLVRSKFLKNQGLSDKYAEWVKKPETVVKYTGFVHELFKGLTRATADHEKDTIDKQFSTLVEKGKNERDDHTCRFIVARDISSSMQSNAVGLNVSSFDVAKAMALYFSEFLTGPFADSYMCFASKVEMKQWKGSTATSRWLNDTTSPFGSTNFIGCLELFARLKKQGVAESDFPTGILCISDGDFNSSHASKTNAAHAKEILRRAGFSNNFVDNFRIVLWNIPNGYYRRPEAQFETTANETGVYYFSGYSGSVISFLLNQRVQTPRDIFDEAMNQTVLNMFEV